MAYQTVLDFKNLEFFGKLYHFLQSHCMPARCQIRIKLNLQ